LVFPLISSEPPDTEAEGWLASTPAPSPAPAQPPIKKSKDDDPNALIEYKAKQRAELEKAKRLRAMRLAKKLSA
jgi:hypothetical protein